MFDKYDKYNVELYRKLSWDERMKKMADKYKRESYKEVVVTILVAFLVVWLLAR